MRASEVAKRQSTLAPARLRSASHASTSRRNVSMSGSRLLKHWRTSTEISTSTMFSHDPCTGVYTNSTRRAMLLARSGSKTS